MNPTHNNPKQPGRAAHAPYNFVPLPEKAVPAEQPLPEMDRYDSERYTGVIECEITTESPLYLRGAVEPGFFKKCGFKPFHQLSEEEKRQYARFFSTDNSGRPAIPGSSLRGMVRSMVEVAAYGKMQWVTRKPLVFRAVGDTTSLGVHYRNLLMRDDGGGRNFTPLVQAGYLVEEKDRWFIRPAQSVQGVSFARIRKDKIPPSLPAWHDCENARRIWVKLDEYGYQRVRGNFLKVKYLPVLEAGSSRAEGFMEAVLARSGWMQSKKMEAVIFPPDESIPTSELIEINDDLLQCYRGQVSQKQEELLGGNEGALRHHQPVFYLIKDGKLVFFGHAMMFRLPYGRSPYEFIPQGLRPETSKVDIDLAEAIFGFTPHGKEDKRASRAGRVYFYDARLEPGQADIWLKLSGQPVVPKILSGPKPTAFQHYLTQQQPDKVESGRRNKNGTPKLELRLDHYASPPPHETVIRGHKFYWHKGRVSLSDIEDNGQDISHIDKQHTLIKPVKPGVKFHSTIHFENLSKAELGAILWALLLPGEHGKEYRHKIGMGKPLGMGSIRIAPKLYLDDRSSRYNRLFDGQNWHRARNMSENWQDFIKVFEEYVLGKMHSPERQGADTLSKVKRIQMLFKILEWPGINDHKLIEYMKLERFKGRPVLPDPLHVETAGAGNVEKQQSKQAPRSQNVTYHNSSFSEAFRKAEEKRNKRK